jgi:hypothetical protein
VTGPLGPPSGELHVVAHVDTSKLDGELERGIDKAAADAEADLRQFGGRDMGGAVADGMETTLEKRGDTLAASIERGIGKQKLKVKSDIDFDDDRVQAAFKRTFNKLVKEFDSAFEEAESQGSKGFFGGITSGLQDAIGAGFNVSGKSSLVNVLVPVFGAIATAVAAAIEAVNAFVAVLTTLPAAIAAVGIQVGILIVAFHGVGEAISGAMSAKNVDEFRKAIENLTPSAQAFVTSLVPRLKQFATDFRTGIQQAFFEGLGDRIIPNLLAMIEDKFLQGTVRIAQSIGQLLQTVGAAFQTPAFINFIQNLLPLIDKWVQDLRPALFIFVQGLSNFAAATLPFFSKLGSGIATLITKAGLALDKLANNKDFQQWLQDMLPVLKSVGELLAGAFEFVVAFVAQLHANGGPELIDLIANSLKQLAFILSSPVGGAAINGFVVVLKLLWFAFMGLVDVLLLLGVAITGVEGAFDAFFTFLGTLVSSIVRFFTDDMPSGFKKGVKGITDEVLALPGKLIRALGDIGRLWFNAGVKLVQGFGEGFSYAWDAFMGIVDRHIKQLTDWLPGSPAKRGPLSGQGWTYRRGQSMVKDFASGIQDESMQFQAAGSSVSSNISFGPGAIRVSYEGVSPTPEEARMTGSAVGEGVLGQLASRNDALAVRTL